MFVYILVKTKGEVRGQGIVKKKTFWIFAFYFLFLTPKNPKTTFKKKKKERGKSLPLGFSY